jgi:hypothetical protein
LMGLLREMASLGFDVTTGAPTVQCRVFEDNSGAIELATKDKFRPRTKHINIQYHHFRSFVDNGSIRIKPIKSNHQPADMLTKPLSAVLLHAHRHRIMGWQQCNPRGSVTIAQDDSQDSSRTTPTPPSSPAQGPNKETQEEIALKIAPN